MVHAKSSLVHGLHAQQLDNLLPDHVLHPDIPNSGDESLPKVISRHKNSSTRTVRWRMLSSSEIWNSSWKLLNLTRDLATIASGCPAAGPINIFKVEVFHQEHFTNTKLNVNTDRKVTEDEETEVLILFFTC